MRIITLILFLACLSFFVLAEEKSTVGIIPKLTAVEMNGAPTLNGGVYPAMGVPCMNFTYYAQYKDKNGREPEYVQLWLNNQWHDLTLLEGTSQSGATYVYHYVPTSGQGNFYYFEASNGVGKVRASIIDSPDNGPVLFSEKLDNNEIVLLDKEGNKIWDFPTGKEWIEGVALSKEGNYIAALTGFHIYLFSKANNVPLWNFCVNCKPSSTMSGNMEGIAISADGSYVAATMQGKLYFFEKSSNQPLWTAEIESGSIGVDMSDDASVIAVGVANAGEKGDKIFIFDKDGNKIGEYKAPHPGYEQTGNFYQPDVTPDGKYVAVSTGCPDRRAYLFSGAGNLIFRSEQLTYDSPVHKSAISDDGSLIAYSADHMQGKEIVFLLDNKGNKLWGFSSQEDGTARAVSISGDGNYIAAGTSGGHIYFFSKDSNRPKWKFTSTLFFSQFGDLKLNQEGSLLAAGGTTKKVYLFSKNSNIPLWEYEANTWVTKIDFNGEYIVAGTGPREYFFEGNSVSSDEIKCQEIIQPEPLMNYLGKSIGSIDSKLDTSGIESSLMSCGNGLCEPPEESENTCCEDCKPNGCEGKRDELDDELFGEDKQTDDTLDNSFCAKFDSNKEACYAYPDKCNWVIKEEICADLNVKGTIKKNVEKDEQIKIVGEEEQIEAIKNSENVSFFDKIIGWFKHFFGEEV